MLYKCKGILDFISNQIRILVDILLSTKIEVNILNYTKSRIKWGLIACERSVQVGLWGISEIYGFQEMKKVEPPSP